MQEEVCFKHFFFPVKEKLFACSYSPECSRLLLRYYSKELVYSQGCHMTTRARAFPSHAGRLDRAERKIQQIETLFTGVFFLRCSKHAQKLLACDDRLADAV